MDKNHLVTALRKLLPELPHLPYSVRFKESTRDLENNSTTMQKSHSSATLSIAEAVYGKWHVYILAILVRITALKLIQIHYVSCSFLSNTILFNIFNL